MKKRRFTSVLLCLALVLSGCAAADVSAAGAASEEIPAVVIVTPAPEESVPEAVPEASPSPAPGEQDTPAQPDTQTPPSEISIWYSAENPLSGLIGEISDAYNASSPAVPAAVRAFDTESELSEALELGSPDLLLCTGSTASGLYDRGSLSAVGVTPAYLPGIGESGEYIGTAYFPLAFSATVLAANSAALAEYDESVDIAEEFSTLEGLCAYARSYTGKTGLPFFAAESYAEIFSAFMHFSGTDFTAVRSKDIRSDVYKTVYNMLALEAQAGSLYIGSDALEQFACGGIPVMFACTDTLAGVSGDLALLPLPGCSGSMGYSVGIAVTSEDSGNSGNAADFLNFMYAYDCSDAAEAAGFISCVSGEAYGGRVYLCSYEKHSALFSAYDDRFASMMELLK